MPEDRRTNKFNQQRKVFCLKVVAIFFRPMGCNESTPVGRISVTPIAIAQLAATYYVPVKPTSPVIAPEPVTVPPLPLISTLAPEIQPPGKPRSGRKTIRRYISTVTETGESKLVASPPSVTQRNAAAVGFDRKIRERAAGSKTARGDRSSASPSTVKPPPLTPRPTGSAA